MILSEVPSTDRPVYARTAATENSSGRGSGRGGEREGGRAGRESGHGVNPNNPHMTLNTQCAYCEKVNHTEVQCWSKNIHLRSSANIAQLKDEGATTDRQWEVNHQARELRQQRLEQERDNREEERENNEDEERFQYMLTDPEQLPFAKVKLLRDPRGMHPTCDEEMEY